MRSVLIAALLGLSTLVPTAASAQSAQYTPSTPGNPPMRVQGIDPMPRFDLQLKNMTQPPAPPQVRDQSPRRVRRAERAATLINQGDCAGARAYAAAEGDSALAARIDQVCAAG